MECNHFFFSSNNKQLYGIIYNPNTDTDKDIPKTGYLLIHPFAEEKKCSQKVFVDIAERLCEEGNYVFMFDLLGCGDSEDDIANASLSIWIDNIIDATSYFKEKLQLSEIAYVGLRLGGFLSVIAAEQSRGISKCILLDPIWDIQKYLKSSIRQKLIKELYNNGEVSSNRDELLQNLENEGEVIDFDGYLISYSFYSDLKKYKNYDFDFSKIKVNLIDISLKKSASRVNVKYSKQHDNIQLHHIEYSPFWSKIELPDFTGLIQDIIEFSKY